jgi:hypothetical protein
MNRRQLPLVSANWWPIEQAFEHLRQHTGPHLACWDLNDWLQTNRLRARRRGPNGSCEMLLPPIWKDDLRCELRQEFVPTKRNTYRFRAKGFAVFSRKRKEWLRFEWVQVWKPDYKKIFDAKAETPASSAQIQEVPTKRGRKPVYEHADLQSVALVLALRRKHGAPEKTRSEVVEELGEWCEGRRQKVPSRSTLFEIVKAAFRLKPTLPR